MSEMLLIAVAAIAIVYALIEKSKITSKVNDLNQRIREKNEKILVHESDIALLHKQLSATAKKAEEEIKRAFEVSKMENKRLKLQVYSAAHDLRQPIERMRGYILLLEMEDFSKKPSDVIENLNQELQLLDQRLMNFMDHGIR